MPVRKRRDASLTPGPTTLERFFPRGSGSIDHGIVAVTKFIATIIALNGAPLLLSGLERTPRRAFGMDCFVTQCFEFLHGLVPRLLGEAPWFARVRQKPSCRTA